MVCSTQSQPAADGEATERERQELIEQILDTNRLFFHRSLRLGGDHYWTEVDLTMRQLKVLLTVVASGRVTMSHLARTVGMTLSSATGVADRLISHGLVRRESDPTDRRLVWLCPTDDGVHIIDRLIQVGASHFRLVARYMKLEDLAVVARAQKLMYKALLDHQSALATDQDGHDSEDDQDADRA